MSGTYFAKPDPGRGFFNPVVMEHVIDRLNRDQKLKVGIIVNNELHWDGYLIQFGFEPGTARLQNAVKIIGFGQADRGRIADVVRSVLPSWRIHWQDGDRVGIEAP